MTSESPTIYAYIRPRSLHYSSRTHSTTSIAKSPSRHVSTSDRELASAMFVEAQSAIAAAPDPGLEPDAFAETVVLCLATTIFASQ